MLQIEVHPYLSQQKLIQFCKQNVPRYFPFSFFDIKDIVVTCYAPLGARDHAGSSMCVLDDPLVSEIAKRVQKSPAQV